MLPSPIVVGLPSSADSYIRHGWSLCPIPEGTKGPTTPGWNKPENALTESPPTGGVGLLHAYSRTCALDIDDYPLAKAWLAHRDVDLDALLTSPWAVQIDSGNPGHGKLLFGLSFPMPSKKIVVDGRTALEFRCGTSNGLSVQDVLPPSRHPSGSTYRWAGRGNWQELTDLPLPLLTIWDQLINEEQQRSIETGENVIPTSLDEIRSALFAINPDLPRKPWVEVGMALESISEQIGQPEVLFELWNEWSSGGEKYKRGEMAAQWRSFKDTPTGIKIATLFWHAKNHGWVRPVPEHVAQMFKPVPKHEIEDVMQQLSPHNDIPACDLSLWPDVLTRFSTEVADEVGCDVIVPIMAGLAAVSGAADKRMGLRLNNNWLVPPTFWSMTLGEPADKKTPGSKPMFSTLFKLQAEDQQRYAAEMLVWRGQEARNAAETKVYREWCASPEAQLPNAVPPTVTPCPPQPLALRLILNDVTSQKMVSMSEGRPRGFLMWMDEMAKWLSKLSDPRNGDDRGAWIQGYETGPYSFDRMGAGSISVENMAMSLYGNCQPAVFRANINSAAIDGLLQRFLPVMLDSSKNAMWKDGLPEYLSCRNEYDDLIRRTYSLPAREYRLDEKAMLRFRGFCQWCLTTRSTERAITQSDIYMTALGKLEGNCGRIMLLFHLMIDPHSEVVSERTAWMAIETMKGFFYWSMRYVFLEVAQQRDKLGELVFEAVLQLSSVRETVSLSELRKASKAIADDPRPSRQLDEGIRVAMDELALYGFVSMLQDHPRYPVWVINPQMAVDHAKERTTLILKKQSHIEGIKVKARNKTGRDVHISNAIGFDSLPDVT